MIVEKLTKKYYPEARIRSHLKRWRLPGVPGILERRILSNFRLLSEWCAPRVLAVYFKVIWNAWVTDGRMRTLLEKQGHTVRTCRLNRGQANSIDGLGHYCICPFFSTFWVAVYLLVWDFLYP